MDYLATTPTDRRVLDAMLPYFCESFGNASSATHSFGQKGSMAVAQARRQVAALLLHHRAEAETARHTHAPLPIGA